MAEIQINLDHLAELARLDFSEEEKQTIAVQLGSILEYVGTLAAVDTKDVPPSAFITDAINVWREDVVEGCDLNVIKRCVEAFPKSVGSALVVPGVFEERTE